MCTRILDTILQLQWVCEIAQWAMTILYELFTYKGTE